MADKKTPQIQFRTPAGIAVYPWLNKADTQFKKTGEYKTGLRLPGDAEVTINGEKVNLKEFIDAQVAASLATATENLKTAIAETTDGKKKATLKKNLAEIRTTVPYSEAVDDDGEPTGEIEYRFKTAASYVDKKTDEVKHRKMTLIDAKKNPMTASVYGGSTLKISANVFPYYTAIAGAGVSLLMRGVQVLELVSGTGGSTNDFDEEDGYEAEAETKQAPGAGVDDDDDDF